MSALKPIIWLAVSYALFAAVMIVLSLTGYGPVNIDLF
jgi:hypothetical protein